VCALTKVVTDVSWLRQEAVQNMVCVVPGKEEEFFVRILSEFDRVLKERLSYATVTPQLR